MRKSNRKSDAVLFSFDELESRTLLSAVQIGAPLSYSESAGTVQVPISLDAPSTAPVTVSYSAKSGTAKAGKDFAKLKGSLTIAPGDTSASIPVTILNDNLYEGNQTFKLSLKVKGATLAASAKNPTVTITDDEAKPTVRLSDATVIEGNKGTKKTVITATLSGPTEAAASVRYQSADLTATVAGKDYKAAHGTLKFKPGKTTATLKIQTKGDTLAEPDEVFNINLARPSNNIATLPAGFSRVVIRDDDGGVQVRPTVAIQAPTIVAGNDATFTLTLSQPSTLPVSFRYATRAGTAVAGRQFTPAEDILTLPAGQTSATITVPTVANSVTSASATFDLVLSTIANGTLVTDHATATLTPPAQGRQGDGNLTLSINNPASAEGNPGNPMFLNFVITLSQASTLPVTVDYATSTDPTDFAAATAGADFVPTSGTATFAPGVTTQIVSVPIVPNTTVPRNPDGSIDQTKLVHRLLMDLSHSTNATISDPEGVGSIIEDDVPNA